MVYKYITYIIYTYTKTYIYIYIYTHIAVVAVVAVQNGENPKPQKKEVGKMVASLALFRPFVQKERDRGKQRNKNKQQKKGGGRTNQKTKQTKTNLIFTDRPSEENVSDNEDNICQD